MEYFRKRFEAYLEADYPVVIAGQTFLTTDVFKTMAEHDYEAHFVEWVSERTVEAKERAFEFLRLYGSLPRFNAMLDRHARGSLIPFIGAGMSYASGYPLWGPFLLSLLDDAPRIRAEVEADLALSLYEDAAQRVFDALGAEPFAEQIHNRMGRYIRRVDGPVRCLPQLFPAEVLTTNFDYVLDHVYQDAALDFVEKFRGTQLDQAGQRLGDIPHSLLRLHGEADTYVDRVLTRSEYDAAYRDLAAFAQILGRIVGARSTLFLGSSLGVDRIFDAFCAIKRQGGNSPTRHYAFLPFPGENAREARLAQLARASIYPIYYPPEDHDAGIEDLLITMIDGGF
ncbi:SIR2 family protein [Sphingomonas asaccharolytica]|uniref:SIR2 family protein n=1 Tax=Sphingomonas asaccharolytica TaxID=40681 RepID=UPI000836BA67|nr:SIR2 family protein [Sphingomonas asaccharolytica]